MGLLLSLWLQSTPAEIPLPSTSSFLPLAVPPSSRLSLILNSASVGPGDRRSQWSINHCSPHFLLSSCGEEVTRTPVQQSSDAVRAERGEKSGMHVWEVLWSPTQRGSHAVIGMTTKNCLLQASGYSALVGKDSESWGWELTTNRLWHRGQSLGTYPRGRVGYPVSSQRVTTKAETNGHRQTNCDVSGSPLLVPERILLVVDVDTGTLRYIVDGFFLGVAFSNLPKGEELFPAISCVRGGATIRLRYLNGAPRKPPALMALCSLSILQSMGKQRWNQTDQLPLPPALQHYILPRM
ncbi:SPRY domain-containing SOCS box protein 2 [Aplochiton taeniatus]